MAPESHVLGFLFSPDLRRVILVRRSGRWHGPGGRVDRGELPSEAVRRIFGEAVGLDVRDWVRFAVLTGVDEGVYKRLHYFYAVSPLTGRATPSGEQVRVLEVSGLPSAGTHVGVDWIVVLAASMASGRDDADEYAVEREYEEPRGES